MNIALEPNDEQDICDDALSAEIREEYESLHWPRSRTRPKPPPNPEVLEAQSNSATVALTAAVRRIGASRLLLARMDWERLFSSASPPGAMTPKLARASLTRQAKKEAAARRDHAARARRQSFQRLLRACAPA
jgi:hypothetical protein